MLPNMSIHWIGNAVALSTSDFSVMLTNKMNEVLENLRKTYNLKIDSPIYIEIEGKEIQFDCLIKGYGVAKGLIVDSKWKK